MSDLPKTGEYLLCARLLCQISPSPIWSKGNAGSSQLVPLAKKVRLREVHHPPRSHSWLEVCSGEGTEGARAGVCMCILPLTPSLGLRRHFRPLSQQSLQLCVPPPAPQLSRIMLGTLGTGEGTSGSCYRAWLGVRGGGARTDLNEFQNLSRAQCGRVRGRGAKGCAGPSRTGITEARDPS